MVYRQGVWIEINWDSGSSGTFGYPVPFGYFMATFIPIVLPYLISLYKRNFFIYKIFILISIMFCYYGLLVSMQRAAIIVATVSIIFLCLRNLNFKKSFLISISFLLLIILSPEYLSFDKEIFSISDIIERISKQYSWMMREDWTIGVISKQSVSPHLYFYNLFYDYGSIITLIILIFYIRLVSMLFIFKNYKCNYLPKDAYIGAILSVISYQVVALFHNNGHFMLDIVGYIGLGYIFLICMISAKSFSLENKIS